MGVNFDFVPAGAAASAVFIEQEAIRGSLGSLLIPQRIALLGQYNTGKTPNDNEAVNILSPDHAADLFGQGSMLHMMAVAAFKGNGTVPIDAFPVPDEGGAVAASGTLTVSGTATSSGTLAIYIAGKRVAVAVAKDDDANTIAAAIDAAINAKADLPVTSGVAAAVVTVTCRWKGLSGNDITIKTNLETSDAENSPTGVTIEIADMASGATDPSLATALSNFNDTWYTWVVCPLSTDTALDELEAAGNARIAPGVKRPFAGLAGYVDTLANLLTFLDARNSAWTTLVPVHGSPNLPLEIAASAAGVCAATAQATPGRPYRTCKLTDIRGGSGANLTYAQRDQAVKAGGSTTMKGADGIIRIEDLVTTRTKNDLQADDDSWRWTETIANIQAKIYSIDQIFSGDPFAQAVVVDDASVTGVSYAIRPKTCKAFAIRLIDELWVPRALTKERDSVVKGIVAEIDGGNPGRINVLIPDVLAAGLKIIAGKIEWSFTAPVGA